MMIIFDLSSKTIIYRLFLTDRLIAMLDNVDFNQNDNISFNNKKIAIFLFFYILLNITFNFMTGDRQEDLNKIIDKIRGQKQALQVYDLLEVFKIEETYQGKWSKIQQESKVLTKKQGYMQMRLIEYVQKLRVNYFQVVFYILDGEYIDQGIVQYQFKCSNQFFNTKIINSYNQVLSLQENKTLDGKYDKDRIFVSVDIGPINATVFDVNYTLHSSDKIDVQFVIKTDQGHIRLSIEGQVQNHMINSIIFAIILTIVSYGPFFALLAILKEISEGLDSAEHYSFITLCGTYMWDTVVCLVALVFAFSNQENLIIFMFPAFIMLLVFSNLQPRILLIVYQKTLHPNNVRELMCKFNLYHYGSLLLAYPLILFTNFNRIFFIVICCLLFPQIYHNGVSNMRPNLSSNYYQKFILIRYLLVFYIKCFPCNVFRFKPDYTLGFICLFILLFQFALLYIQKMYGSKKVIPQFMLPPCYNYNYKYEQQFNLQQGQQVADCSICLTPLHSEPPGSQTILFQVQYKLMKTPCKHRYHSSCLIEWMNIKKECPECRAVLPPFQ